MDTKVNKTFEFSESIYRKIQDSVGSRTKIPVGYSSNIHFYLTAYPFPDKVGPAVVTLLNDRDVSIRAKRTSTAHKGELTENF